jgi:hypothetical protein
MADSGAKPMTDERLLEALEAWNRQDPDLVLSYMTADCTYHASFGPELFGKTYVGSAKVREGLVTFFESYPGGEFVGTEVWVNGEHGSAEWTFVAPSVGVEVRGCDLFEFDGDLIKTKNAFRKAGA